MEEDLNGRDHAGHDVIRRQPSGLRADHKIIHQLLFGAGNEDFLLGSIGAGSLFFVRYPETAGVAVKNVVGQVLLEIDA